MPLVFTGLELGLLTDSLGFSLYHVRQEIGKTQALLSLTTVQSMANELSARIGALRRRESEYHELLSKVTIHTTHTI
jgi:hypothetical protein